MNQAQAAYIVDRKASSTEYSAIVDVLKRYYDALYRCDVILLATIFHSNAQYFTASSGELSHFDMNAYFPIIEQRISPQSSGESCEFSVDSIEFAGPVTAIARMYISMFSKDFIDLLTLIKVDGEWRIISKVFHYTTHDETHTDR